MAKVFHSERNNTGSFNVARQLSSVQGSAILKKPNSFMKVPVTRRIVGSTVITRANDKTKANAG
jgi:hypothetical protein